MNLMNNSEGSSPAIRSAQVVLMCEALQPNLDFFVERLGFRLESISPADAPRRARISGHGMRIELRRGNPGNPGALCIESNDGQLLQLGNEQLLAPNGTRIEITPYDQPLVLPKLEEQLVISRLRKGADWGVGRAGMRYRDLIPGRLGGRYIASHIQIAEGGPVPDSVHFHQIRFQMIFCVKGWVRVAYEDQGEPQLLEAGDCFLQPPEMRHRVLESSSGLEVIEIACPAEHDTWIDHEMNLPTAEIHPERDFGGQRFVFHQAAKTPWEAEGQVGLEFQDVGIAKATDGMARVRVLRAANTQGLDFAQGLDHEFLFLYVLKGELQLRGKDQASFRLADGDSASLPPIEHWRLSPTPGAEWLEVRL
jgi:quercetin dioxygenase-like cupin family protein